MKIPARLEHRFLDEIVTGVFVPAELKGKMPKGIQVRKGFSLKQTGLCD